MYIIRRHKRREEMKGFECTNEPLPYSTRPANYSATFHVVIP